MITLTHLRALLERALTHTTNPAILRVPEKERTVVGLAKAYLSRSVWFDSAPHPGPDGFHSPHREVFNDRIVGCFTYNSWMGLPLDLTEVGTAHALLVALALALDIDPGMGVVATGWADIACDKAALYDSLISGWGLFVGGRRCAGWVPPDWKPTWTPYTIAPTVAAEPDPLKALVLAVLHVLAVEP